MAFAMQQLLISWLLIGVLKLAADDVGLLQALMGLPGIFLMLWGGASADRTDPKSLLLKSYTLAPLLPLFLVAVYTFSELSVWSVVGWGLGMSVLMSVTQPAQQAILNRVAGSNVQRAVSAATAVGFLVRSGLMPAVRWTTWPAFVLIVQGACFALGALAVKKSKVETPPPTTQSSLNTIWEGEPLRAQSHLPRSEH